MREKAIKIKRKRCASDWFLDIFKVVFLVLVTVICVYPFWNIFVVSINDATDALRGGLYFLPRKLSLASYKDILGRATFLHGILSLYFVLQLVHRWRSLSRQHLPMCFPEKSCCSGNS